ncbi:MAG: ABC transporter permease subunit [Tenericutes bacterium]|nr:ABC transporter permease subunit [Mycoplasmatota bacterium]
MNSTQKNKLNIFISYMLAVLTILAFVVFIVLRQTTSFSFAPYSEYNIIDSIKTGFINTIIVSIISLLGSLILGFILYLLSKSKIKYFNALVDVFTEIIYGTPLLVLVIIAAFLIGPAFNTRDTLMMGIIALIVYMSPYMKNVYKSAFSSISEEQYMAINLFGFTSYQKYRYIIIPQVIRILMPPMMNNFSLIIKGSALLSVLAYNELYYSVVSAQYSNFAFVEGYILMWGLYLIITIPLSQLSKFVERKWSL